MHLHAFLQKYHILKDQSWKIYFINAYNFNTRISLHPCGMLLLNSQYEIRHANSLMQRHKLNMC